MEGCISYSLGTIPIQPVTPSLRACHINHSFSTLISEILIKLLSLSMHANNCCTSFLCINSCNFDINKTLDSLEEGREELYDYLMDARVLSGGDYFHAAER